MIQVDAVATDTLLYCIEQKYLKLTTVDGELWNLIASINATRFR